VKALAAALACAVLAAACGGTSPKNRSSDWEDRNARLLMNETPDQAPTPPAYPDEANLARFFVTSASDFSYFVDRTSIVPDGLFVRYVLVARSPSGVDNVSYEALNCRDREARSLARGTNDRKWIVHPTEWRRIDPTRMRPQYTLHQEYFCANNAAITSAAEGAAALQKGGHPWSASGRLAPGGTAGK